METKKIAVLVGTVVTIIVFGIVLWFLIPSSKIDEKVTVMVMQLWRRLARLTL